MLRNFWASMTKLCHYHYMALFSRPRGNRGISLIGHVLAGRVFCISKNFRVYFFARRSVIMMNIPGEDGRTLDRRLKAERLQRPNRLLGAFMEDEDAAGTLPGLADARPIIAQHVARP